MEGWIKSEVERILLKERTVQIQFQSKSCWLWKGQRNVSHPLGLPFIKAWAINELSVSAIPLNIYTCPLSNLQRARDHRKREQSNLDNTSHKLDLGHVFCSWIDLLVATVLSHLSECTLSSIKFILCQGILTNLQYSLMLYNKSKNENSVTKRSFGNDLFPLSTIRLFSQIKIYFGNGLTVHIL